MTSEYTASFSAANFDAEVLGSDQPVLVDFYADWCQPCRALGPTVDELAGEFAGRVKVGAVDVDAESSLAQDYDIQPATPETRDRFIEAVNQHFLPAQAKAGGTLVAAWFSYSGWFYRITQLIEFDDLTAYDGFRQNGQF